MSLSQTRVLDSRASFVDFHDNHLLVERLQQGVLETSAPIQEAAFDNINDEKFGQGPTRKAIE
jgi:hypothetical protein